jgi:hypothetical protein
MKNIARLLPNTKRLKQVIKDFGSMWHIEHGPEKMQCFNNEKGFRIRSLNDKHVRNVRKGDISFD